MDREAVIASREGPRRIRRWSREEVGEAKRGEGVSLGEKKGGDYLLNIAVRAYPDGFSQAIPCTFSLCPQIRNTSWWISLLFLAGVRSWGGCSNGLGEGYLWWQGADCGVVSEDEQ